MLRSEHDNEHTYNKDDDNERGNGITSDGHNETEGGYFRHALLFLTKAYVLGRKVHDEYFQFEITKVIRDVQSRMMLGYEEYETTMEAVTAASRIIAEG